MPLKNPADALDKAPIADLIDMLLKQFKRLLKDRGVTLTSIEARQIADVVAAGHAPGKTKAICVAMRAIVEVSLVLLQNRWGLAFAQALAADMNTIGGWETTAEFIEIANEKENAELRISAGAALLAMLGDRTYLDRLLDVIAHDAGANDVDAVFARRALLFASGVEASAKDWLAQVREWASTPS